MSNILAEAMSTLLRCERDRVIIKKCPDSLRLGYRIIEKSKDGASSGGIRLKSCKARTGRKEVLGTVA
jgi:hypothetical protein